MSFPVACAQPLVDPTVFHRALDSLRHLPSFERAEMSVSLAVAYSKACVASGPGAQAQGGLSLVDRSAGLSRSPVCGESCGVSDAGSASGAASVTSSALDSGMLAADGRCYLAMAAKGCRSKLYKSLGRWPTFARLLAAPASCFDFSTMADVLLVRVTDGTWHISSHEASADQGLAAPTALETLSRLVEGNLELLQAGLARWRGTLLEHLQLHQSLGYVDVPSLSDKVGGAIAKTGLGFAPVPGGAEMSRLGAASVVNPADVSAQAVLWFDGVAPSGVLWGSDLCRTFGDSSVVAALFTPSYTGKFDAAGYPDASSWREQALMYSDLVLVSADDSLNLRGRAQFLERVASTGKLCVYCAPGTPFSVGAWYHRLAAVSGVTVVTAQRELCQFLAATVSRLLGDAVSPVEGEQQSRLEATGAEISMSTLCGVASVMRSDLLVSQFGVWSVVKFPYDVYEDLWVCKTVDGYLCLALFKTRYIVGVLPVRTMDPWSSEVSRALRAAVLCAGCGGVARFGCCGPGHRSTAASLVVRMFMPVGVDKLSLMSAVKVRGFSCSSLFDSFGGYPALTLSEGPVPAGGSAAEFPAYRSYLSG